MEELGRILGLDIGEARTGVAVSDPLQIIASPHGVVNATDPGKAVQEIARLVEELGVVRIVAGLPLDREGGVGPQAEKTLAFLDRLRAAVDVEILTQDERFSSASAQRTLAAANVPGRKRKKSVDKIAAALVLQTYLDRQATARNTGG